VADGAGFPVVTAWSAISPFGYGRSAFAAGLREGRGASAYLVPDFDIAGQLGNKGTGSMDRTSALAISTAGRMLKDVQTDARTGVVLGTTSGSVQTQFDFTRESLVRRKPYFVNPALMPFALMNSAAAQCAIWHGLTGPNTTVAGGRSAGLAVLRYARRLLATGRASGVVCGAAEECSPTRELLDRRDGTATPLGEGCAVLFLEPPGSGRPALAGVLAVETRLALAGGPGPALVECLRGVLAAAGDPRGVSAVALSTADPVLGAVERDAVDEVLGQVDQVVTVAALIGDTGAATGPFQLAALLSLTSGAAGRLAVATSVDDDGTVGCVLVRLLAAG
jgi:3-oxoacyl-[acyl-carrier-protein] synthase II